MPYKRCNEDYSSFSGIQEHEWDQIPLEITEIFSEDKSLMQKTFWGIIKKGKLYNLKRLGMKSLKVLADDIYQTTWDIIFTYYSDGTLSTIKKEKRKAYICSIIRYKMIDENNFLSRLISFEELISGRDI